MKKNLFIAALAFVAMGANAQVVNTLDGYQAGDQFEKDGVKYELIAVEDGNPVKVVGAVAEEVTVQEAFSMTDNYTVTDFTAGLAQMDLTKVTATADEPMEIAEDFFTEATFDGTLIVSNAAWMKYAEADVWSNFLYLQNESGKILGDLEEDEELDVSDIVAIVELINEEEYNEQADVNGDGDVDVSDIVALIEKIKRI